MSWIKCSERMPEDEELIFGYDDNGVVWTAFWDGIDMYPDTKDYGEVNFTHWQPLPPPPAD